MKTITVLCLLCATVYAFPAVSNEDSNDSEIFDPLLKKGTPSVVEVDVGDPDDDDDSFFIPITSFFRPVLVNPLTRFNFGFPSLFPSSFFNFSNLFSSFNKVPEGAKVTNSTSDVRIVDGHKITVNTTTYEQDNGSIFKYEIIEVTHIDKPGKEGEKPVEETTKGAEEAVTKKPEPEEATSPKGDNNSLDNEIFREEVSPPDQSDDLIA